MNKILQDHWITILFFLIFVIFVLIFFIFYLFSKILKNDLALTKLSSKVKNPQHHEQPQITEHTHCIIHQDELSTGSCLICEDVFCDNCLVDHESMHFCKEHFRLFASNSWKQITDLKTTPDTPEDGIFIYHFKRDLWFKNKIPSFVMTHYKINIEHDFIESFIQLNVRESDAENLTKQIQNYKAQN